MKPKLTRARWSALKKLEASGDRPFIAASLDIHGAALYSLEECGWVERVDIPDDLPFAIATQGHHWRVTTAGREAIAALPIKPPRRT
jgi:DNA-binding MarR family transcriptional regulator